MANLTGLFLSNSPHWRTPKKLYQDLDDEFHFTHDPAPIGGIMGFLEEWTGRVFINPPYGPRLGLWLEKAVGELRQGRIELAVFLLPARTDVKWFHEWVLPLAKEIRFIKGRLHFNEKGPAPFPSMVVVFDESP